MIFALDLASFNIAVTCKQALHAAPSCSKSIVTKPLLYNNKQWKAKSCYFNFLFRDKIKEKLGLNVPVV